MSSDTRKLHRALMVLGVIAAVSSAIAAVGTWTHGAKIAALQERIASLEAKAK